MDNIKHEGLWKTEERLDLGVKTRSFLFTPHCQTVPNSYFVRKTNKFRSLLFGMASFFTAVPLDAQPDSTL